MVYINTLMIQRVLSEQEWWGRMTAEDFRGLLPLIYGHISPYGTFVLDMTSRLNLEPPVITLPIKWLRVLGTTEMPHIDQRIRHQFHPVVALLDVLETEQQPLEFVLPRKGPLDALP